MDKGRIMNPIDFTSIYDCYNHLPTDSSPSPSHNVEEVSYKKKLQNGWNEYNNRLLVIWMMRSIWMSQSLYSKLRKFTTIWHLLLFFQICFSAFSSALSVWSYGVNVSRTTDLVDILIILFSVLSTIIAAVVATFEYPRLIEKLRYGVTRFSKLGRNIEKIINMSSSRRPTADDFLNTVNHKYHKYHTSGHYLVQEMTYFHSLKKELEKPVASDHQQKTDTVESKQDNVIDEGPVQSTPDKKDIDVVVY
jgi:hypothetical protein